MCWLKRDIRNVCIVIIGMLLLYAFMVCAPALVAAAHEKVLGPATPGAIMVQATPTEDATVVAAQRDKIIQEDRAAINANDWWRTNVTAIFTSIGGLGVLISATWGIWIGFRGANDARKKQHDDQVATQKQQKDQLFQNTIAGLGSERVEARAIAASMLLTFLQQPAYETFHQQIFNLVVTNLRFRHIDLRTSEHPDSLSQALITVFKESFPLVRKALMDQEKPQLDKLQHLDASLIRLDNAYLRGADLEGIWMRDAFLMKAELRRAKLSNAYLTNADLSHANLRKANLNGARLHNAKLSHAHLDEADLEGAYLKGTNFEGAYLGGANFEGAYLEGANFRGAKGLTKEQSEVYKAKGAIVDENTTTNLASPTNN